MGWIAKSLNRQQDLNPFGEGVAQFFNAIKQKRDKEDFMESVKAGIMAIKEAYNPGVDQVGHTGNITSGNFQPTFKPGEVDYQKGNKISDQVMNDFMVKAMEMNLSWDDIEKGFTIMQQQKKSMQPPASRDFERDPKKELWRQTEGKAPELIRESKTEVKKEKDTKIGERITPDNKKIVTYKKADSNETYEIDLGPVRKDAGIKVDIKPPKSEKWKEVGDLLAALDYKQDDKGGYVDRTPEEKESVKKIIRKKSLSNLTPRAQNWFKALIEDRGNVDIGEEDFAELYNASKKNWKFSPEDLQSLEDYNSYRPRMWDLKGNIVKKKKK